MLFNWGSYGIREAVRGADCCFDLSCVSGMWWGGRLDHADEYESSGSNRLLSFAGSGNGWECRVHAHRYGYQFHTWF